MIAIGGDSKTGPQSSVEVLQNGEFCNKAFNDLPSSRWGHVAFPLPDYSKFLVCGGKGKHHDPTYLGTCLTYTGSTWTNHSVFQQPRHYAASVTMERGDIYVLGGSYSPMTSEVLRNGSAKWSVGPNLQIESFIFKACAATIDAVSFVTIGGGISYDMVSVFNTSTEVWTNWAKLPGGRRGHSCGRLDDKVVVAGGYLFTTYDYTATTLLIDTKTGAATEGGRMIKARAYYSMQVLPGMLLAIGGSTIRSFQVTVEKLTHPSAPWSATDLYMETGRSTFATVPYFVPNASAAQTATQAKTQKTTSSLIQPGKCEQPSWCSEEGGMCYPKGRQPFGTFKVSERKCQRNMECYCYRYNQGKVLLNSITVQTKVGCTDGCSKEGVVVSLRGERSLHYPKGLPCSTRLLDHASTIDFDGTNRKTIFDGKLNGTENFEEEAMLGDCYQVISLIKKRLPHLILRPH